jgi:hypothetical protein
MGRSAGELSSFFLEQSEPLLTRGNFAFRRRRGCKGPLSGRVVLIIFSSIAKNNSLYSTVANCYPSQARSIEMGYRPASLA